MLPDALTLAATETVSLFELALAPLGRMLQQPYSGLILRCLFLLAAGAAGLYAMLPRGQRAGRRFEHYIGGALATLSLVLLVTSPVTPSRKPGAPADSALLPANSAVAESQDTVLWSLNDQSTGTSSTFFLLSFLSLASAVLMITSRNPVYSALWFAMVLLGNSGLYLLQGAEFLSAATIIVYAGAIVVTFLFVIMLAQPNGAAPYDRWSREPLLSSIAGLILASVLVGTLHHAARLEFRGGTTESSALPSAELIAKRSALPDARHRSDTSLHVFGLGRSLFLDHVASVEVIGVLLLAAVVGAMLIAGHRVDGPGPRRPAN